MKTQRMMYAECIAAADSAGHTAAASTRIQSLSPTPSCVHATNSLIDSRAEDSIVTTLIHRWEQSACLAGGHSVSPSAARDQYWFTERV